MRNPTIYLKLVFVTLALFVSACSSNSESGTDGTSIPTDTSDQVASTTPDTEPADQPNNVNDINDIIESVRANHDLPAMGGAIVTADSIIALGVAGTRRIDGPSVTSADSWHIGSNLKAITSLLAGIAVDTGVITWEQTVAESFPEMSVGESYRAVTLRELVSHQGGISNSPPAGIATAADARGQRDQIIAWALGQPAASERGNYYYSNVGYVMAGAMIERAYDSTYEAIMDSTLMAPLGVVDYGWGAQTSPDASDNPVPHFLDGDDWTACEGCDNPPWLSAAGRMHLPLEQWATIIREMIRADDGRSTIVSAATGSLLFKDEVSIGDSADSYGYGWVVTQREWAGGKTLVHDGSNTTNHSVVWLSPSRDVAFLAVTNAADLEGGRTAAALDAVIVELLEWFESNG